MTDITLSEDDWSPFVTPVLMARNLTVMGARQAMEDWVMFDMAYIKAKILLGPGIAITVTRVVMARSVPPQQPLAMYILASNAGSLGPPGVALATNTAMLYRTCYPPSFYDIATPTWPRAPGYPGNQTGIASLPLPIPAPCVNSSTAPLMRRCWPRTGLQVDIAVVSMLADQYGKQTPTGNVLVCRNMYWLCQLPMTESCVERYGAILCFQLEIAPTLKFEPEYHVVYDGVSGGGGGSIPAAEVTAPPPLSALPPAQPSSSSSGGGGITDGGGGGVGGQAVPLGPLLGGLLGGGFLVAVLVLVTVVARTRIRNRAAGRSLPGTAKSGSPSDVSPANEGSGLLPPEGKQHLSPAGVDPWVARPTTKPHLTVVVTRETVAGSANGEACHDATPSAPYPGRDAPHPTELELNPVTAQTPFQPDIDLSVLFADGTGKASEGPSSSGWGSSSGGGDGKGNSCAGGSADVRSGDGNGGNGGGGDGGSEAAKLELLPTLLGKGGFGRVVLGVYRGQPVAVKLLSTGLLGEQQHAVAQAVVVEPAAGNIAVPPAAGGGAAAAPSEWGSGLGGARTLTAAAVSAALAAAIAEEAPAKSTGARPSANVDGLPPIDAEPARAAASAVEAAVEAVAAVDVIMAVECAAAEEATGAAAASSVSVPDGATAQPGAPGSHAALASAPSPAVVSGPQAPARTRPRGALSTLAQEVEVLARCRHPNVVTLLAANLTPPRVCLVMELMDTSLARLLHGGAGPLPLAKILHIAIQVARALSYLHPTIMHRDLKPANVLVSQADSPAPVVKLADFGLSRLRSTVLVTTHPEVGTAPYMAPEVFDAFNIHITDRVDIYAFGVILWEMLSGQRPWQGMDAVQVAYTTIVRRARLPLEVLSEERCPPKLRSLMVACWDLVPDRRPAAAEIVKTLVLLQQEALTQPGRATADDGQ